MSTVVNQRPTQRLAQSRCSEKITHRGLVQPVRYLKCVEGFHFSNGISSVVQFPPTNPYFGPLNPGHITHLILLLGLVGI